MSYYLSCTIRRALTLSAVTALLMLTTRAIAQPAIGDLLEATPGDHFRGWHVQAEATGLYGSYYNLFDHGGATLIAIVEPVVQNARGGITVKRITHTLIVRPMPGETTVDGHDCPFLSLTPAVAFYSETTRTARGFFVLPGEIRAMRWFVDEPHSCEYGGD